MIVDTGSPAIQRMLIVRNVMTSDVRMLPINVNQRYASQPGNNWIKEIKMIIVISKIVLFNFKKFYLI